MRTRHIRIGRIRLPERITVSTLYAVPVALLALSAFVHAIAGLVMR